MQLIIKFITKFFVQNDLKNELFYSIILSIYSLIAHLFGYQSFSIAFYSYNLILQPYVQPDLYFHAMIYKPLFGYSNKNAFSLYQSFSLIVPLYLLFYALITCSLLHEVLKVTVLFFFYILHSLVDLLPNKIIQLFYIVN